MGVGGAVGVGGALGVRVGLWEWVGAVGVGVGL